MLACPRRPNGDPVLLVDDAQELITPVLTEMRLLGSTDFDSRASHDDTGETLVLALSNASGATISGAEATGTIANDGPLQR